MTDFSSISRLSAKCRKCPYIEKCDHKEMEAVGYLKPASSDCSLPTIQPMMKKQDLRNIKIDENTTVTVDLEELKENIEKDFYKNLGIGVMKKC